MRTLPDRIRHTMLFEIIALSIVAVAGSWVTGRPLAEIGLLGGMLSLLAMTWNLGFNWLFDHWDRKYRNSRPRGVLVRIAHACLFEVVLLITATFLVAWWLDYTLWYAFILDIGVSIFFLIYAFCFNWSYDVIFPVPASS
jgi:uncharacterized membrane protein